jgi:hypothetical protein
VLHSQCSQISCLSPFIKCDTFLDQLFQFIQLMLREIDKPNPECSIDRPLHLGLLDQNRCVVSRDNQLDSYLPSRLNHEGAFNLGAAERQIDGLPLELV